MRVTCPSCGADMDLDVLLAHEDSRHALAQLAAMSLPLGKLVLQYLRLFKPASRQMSHSRVVKLIGELLPDLQRQSISRKGREWSVPRESWSLAIEHVLAMRDKGSLTLPLTSHGYLYEVLAGMADKVEAQAERDVEAQRRGRAHSAGVESAITAASVAAAQRAIAAGAALIAQPYGPSLYARKVKAEAEARKARQAAADGAASTEELS